MAGAHGVRTFLLATVVGGLSVLALGAGLAHATHYPDGSRCYDCHAVSASQMVPGSHLIKMSQKVVDLGMVDGTARCLFCHEKNAVSVPYSDTRDMQGALDHFDATSTSKHPVALSAGTFTPDNNALDCLDCHVGLNLTVANLGDGNTTIHGIDAATDDVDLYATLRGTPADAAAVSASTCQNTDCHDSDGGTVATGGAPAGHTFAGTTLNDGSAPTACTDCHGTHNSYQGAALITLRDTGTTSNNPGDPLATRVTPDRCGECHTQDDAGGGYTTAGHGRAAIAGGFSCTVCHSAGVPHAFSRSAPGSNPLRFALAENTSAQSAVRQEPPYHQVYSVCLNCHNAYANAAHKGHDGIYAGCNDCHEPHGSGVGANAMMIRAVIPKVNLAGNPVYGDGSGASYETNVYAGTADLFRADGQGLCDNAECHQGQLSAAGNPIYPLAGFMGSGWHSDAAQNPGDDCSACHSHTDSGGSWGAKSACLTCHGQPPPAADAGYSTFLESTTGHQKHAAADAYGYACSVCHAQYPTGHKDAVPSYQSVFFGPLNPTGSYNAGTYTCNNLYCHSDGQSAASVGAAPAWDAGTQSCHACHGGIDVATRVSTASHAAHLAWTEMTCVTCHADTVSAVGTDTTTTIANPAAHVNGAKDLRPGGMFYGESVAFTPGTGTCSAISCHGGGNATWGATLGCADCHLPVAGADRNNYVFADGQVAAAAGSEWATAGHGRASGFPSGNPAAAFSGPPADPQGCAYCHDFDAPHGQGTNPFRLANRSGTAEDSGWNHVCLVCHQTADSGYDPDGPTAGYTLRDGTRDVDENHYGTKHADPAQGGTFCWDCHDPHGDNQPYMIHGGDGSAPGRGVTDLSDGAYGIPTTSRPVTGFDVVAGGYTSADLANVGNTGLCQTCHAAAAGAAYYNRSTFTALASHNGADASRCTACHLHTKEFAASCDLCHGNPPTTVGDGFSGVGDTDEDYPGGAGAHLAHFKGVGKLATDPDLYSFGCLNGACHPGGQHAQGGTTVSRANVQVAFAPSWNPQGVFTPNATAAQAACTQLYCHSNGLVENGENAADGGTGEAGVSGLGEYAENSGKATFYGTTPARPAVWGGSLDCKGCHGKGSPNYKRFLNGLLTDDTPVSLPDYLNSDTQSMQDGDVIYNTTGANTHFLHVYKLPNHVSGGCRCHDGSMAKNVAPVGHVNRRTDVNDCNSNCHVGVGTYTWGAKYGSDAGPSSCVFWCHGNYSLYNSPGGRVLTPMAGPIFVHDQQPKYIESGHGLATGSSYASGNAGAGLKCSACHLGDDRYTVNGPLVASYHYERDPIATGYAGSGSLADNPYWLKAPYAADPNGLCLSCHDGATALDAATHSAGAMISAGFDPNHDVAGVWPTFTPKCVDCHDPHGEPNWYMLYDGDAEKTTSGMDLLYAGPVIFTGERLGVTKAQSDVYGKPPTPYATTQTAVALTGNALGSDYATGTGTGVCEVCHTQTTVYNQSGTGESHATAPCTSCHDHQKGFAASCTGCHGGGTVGANQSNYWPDSSARGTADSATANDAGAHFEHLRALARHVYNLSIQGLLDDAASGAKQEALCAYCHLSPGADADHATGDDAAEVTNLRFFDGSADNGGSDAKASVTDAAAAAWNGATCTNADCHYEVATPGWYAANQTGNADCTVCHTGLATHITGGCVSCHPGGTATGYEKHTANAGGTVVTIPLPPASWTDPSGRLTGTDMRSQLGIRYSAFGGIHLGGDSANSQAASEAEVCWKCHDANSRSEWGYNTKTNSTMTGFSTVWSQFTTNGDGVAESRNYGWIYQNNYTAKVADWTAGYWMSAYDPNLKRRVASVHSVSFDPAGQSSSVGQNVVQATGKVKQDTAGNPNGDTASPVLEAKAYLRCAYCHDVHDTFGPNGKPHLRGAWVGDPYPPGIPPRQNNTVINSYTYTYATRVNSYGWAAFTPRGLSLARDRGGYFIDQNSGFPTDDTAMDSVAETAELCTLCHGTEVDTMDFYTNSSLWRFAPPTQNGHSNSTLGGTGSKASDLFNAYRGDHSEFLNRAMGMGMQASIPGPPYNCGSWGDQCEPEYPQSSFMSGRENSTLRNSGWFGGPVNTATQGGGDFANWYAEGRIGGMSAAGTRAHKFTCSKCHSPHATGLPALLTMNCIDATASNWKIYGATGADGTNLIANNCHRKTTTEDGWHKLAPGQ